MKEADGVQRVPHVDLEQQTIWVPGEGRRFRAYRSGRAQADYRKRSFGDQI